MASGLNFDLMIVTIILLFAIFIEKRNYWKMLTFASIQP